MGTDPAQGGGLRRGDGRDEHARGRLLTRLAQQGRPDGVLDELPELRRDRSRARESRWGCGSRPCRAARRRRGAPSRRLRTPARATPPDRRSASACGATPRCTCRRRRRRRRTCRCPRGARGSRPPGRSCRARPRVTKPTPAIAKLRRTTSAESARAMTSIAVGAMRRRDRSCKRSRSQTSTISPRPRKSAARASMKSSVSVDRPCMSAVAMRRSSSMSGSSARELHQVLDEDRRGRADVDAHVDEARLRGRRRRGGGRRS